MSINVEQFVALMAAHQREVYRYIVALVPCSSDADDIFQETSITLWQEIAKFEPGSDFAAWACTVAHYRVLAYRTKAGRDRHVFSPKLLDRLAERRAAMSDELDGRRTALDDCLRRLTADQRDLINQRYGSQTTMQDLAARTGRSVHTIYKTLDRVRDALQKCIEHKLSGDA